MRASPSASTRISNKDVSLAQQAIANGNAH